MSGRPPAHPPQRPAFGTRASARESLLGFRTPNLRLPASASAALVLLALVAITLVAVAIDVRTRVSVAAFGWLYLLVILPVTLRWGRAAGLVTGAASLLLLLTFLTEPRGLPYTKNSVDVIRLAISMIGVAIAILLIDQVNRRLASSDRLLAALVTSSGDAVTGETLDGTVLSWSPGAERLYGYRPEEVIGRPLSLLVPAGQDAELRALAERLRQGERIVDYQTARITKDGRRLDVELTLSPTRDPSGSITGASAVARDVSALRRVEAALKANQDALGRAIEETTGGAVLLDVSGRTLIANQTARGLLRHTGEGHPIGFADLFSGRFTLQPPLHWRALARAQPSSFLAVDVSGAPLWLRAEVTALDTGRPDSSRIFLMTIRDATQEVEEAYQQLMWREHGAPPKPARGTGLIARLDGGDARQALTTREAEVLGLIAAGRSNQQIADDLGITVNTVERHIANMYRKLQIRSRAQATAYALHHGLLPELSEQD